MHQDERFQSLVAPELPMGKEFTVTHVKTSPKKCMRLIFSSSRDKSFDVTTTHFFILSHDAIDVLGLELNVYESADHFTIFVAKADTSGHYYGDTQLDVRALVRAILAGMLRYYVPVHKLVRISLFAKAESQYLFLGSKHNSRKHVLDDGQLLKWWVKCLDGLHSEFKPYPRCTLQIPGANSAAVKRYLPPAPHLPWKVGDIYSSDDEGKWAVKCIPRFPDDPKHRFLDFIVAEGRAKRVNCAQFWLELESRQEFRLGTSVGVIGIEGYVKAHETLDGQHSVNTSKYQAIKNCLMSQDFSTRQQALLSSARVAKLVPECSYIHIVGTRIPEARPAKRSAEPDVAVNLLGASMVRKKRNVT